MKNVIGIICANYSLEALGTLTDKRTISSLPFGGRYRLIDFPLSNMVNAGIDTVGVITPYKYRSIIDHIGSGKYWQLNRKNGGLFILPGSVFGIGNPGSRFLLRDIERNSIYLNRSPAEYVLITSANTVCSTNYCKLIHDHIESGADITMMYKMADTVDPYMSSVKAEKGRVVGVSKGVKPGDMEFLDCFVISRILLLRIVEWFKAVDYLDFFEMLDDTLDKIDVRTFECRDYAKSITDIPSYYEVSMELLTPEVRHKVFEENGAVYTKIQDNVATEYLESASVSNSLLPSGCRIAGTVKNCIFFGMVNVEEGAVVENSIVMKGCTIEKGAVVKQAIIDRNNIVRAGTVIAGTKATPYIIGRNTESDQ